MSVLISVYTPTNNPTWLVETYASLLRQTYSNWEWIVYANGDKADEIVKQVTQMKASDVRIAILSSPFTSSVGSLKYQACQAAKGEILVELDHDDQLVENCLEEIHEAVSAGAGFVYSDWVGYTAENTYESYPAEYGWESYEFFYKEKVMKAMSAFEPSARSICEIFYAPNHVRAWSKEAYTKVGGYNPSLKVGDDHDLVARTYLAGVQFTHIKKPLYMYRLHANNTVKLFNAEIQAQQAANRDKYTQELAIEETRRKGLIAVNIGPKEFTHKSVEFTNLYVNAIPIRLPLKDGSAGVLRVYDYLQLIAKEDVLNVLEEYYRVLAPGGWLLAAVPSTDGRGAFQDLRHKSYWNENSWLYFTEQSFNRHYYPPENRNLPIKDRPRFQLVRSSTSFPSSWHEERLVSYTYADMCALKGQSRQPGRKAL